MSRELLLQELKRWFSFPPDRPTEADLDAILTNAATFEVAQQKPPTYADVDRIVRDVVIGTRVNRYDGLNFQDVNVLLAMLRVQAQTKK
jgi:hypothetical protein